MTDLPAIGCYSYLAATHTLNVEEYPRIDYGTNITSAEHFLAGDGPLVAAFLRAFGHPVILASNQVSDDLAGRSILNWLLEWGVSLAPNDIDVARTRTNVVVCDKAGHRTWYSDLAGIADELSGVDVQALARSPIVYIDCYEVLLDAPREALAAALANRSRVFLNLGGSPPPAWLVDDTRRQRLAFLQTNASEDDSTAAERTLDALTALDVADLVIVTTGRRGALACEQGGETLSAPAKPVAVRQVQGAGAAFSAALIHTQSDPHGSSSEQRLRFACAAGSLWCGRQPDGPLPTREQVLRFEAD